MSKHIFKGLITAMITPFKNNFDKSIDFSALEKLIDLQINAKVDSILIAGSTGESSSLSYDEYESLVKFAVKHTNGKVPVIAGCFANNTIKAIQIAKDCEKLKVQGIMCVTPFYNKPSQDGLYQHFKAIHDATSNLPIMLYSVPSRTGIDFQDETIVKLSMLDRIVAIKDASNDLERPLRIKSKLGNKITFLCGSDSLALGFYGQGGEGSVSVTSNILPTHSKKLLSLWQNNNFAEALQLHLELMPIYNAMFIETNPVPVKYIASELGFCSSEVRLPLCQLTKSHSTIIKQILNKIKELLLK